jgi:hypothetical protein
MKDFNRHNLTGEDIAAIILLLVGGAIIGTTLFWSMPRQTREDVAAVANLPFYENLMLQAVGDTTLVVNSVPLFLEKFNQEFTKIAVIDLSSDFERVPIGFRDTVQMVNAVPLFLEKFNQEFTKIVAIDLPIDPDRLSIALHDTSSQIFALSEYVGQSYKELHNPNKQTYGAVAIEKIGQVMGASIDLEEQMKANGMRVQRKR